VARLRGVHVWQAADGWTATVAAVELGARESLLPASLLQELQFSEPDTQGPAPGPALLAGGLTLDQDEVELVFSRLLAPASVTSAAFLVSEFVEATGWAALGVTAATYDASVATQPTVRLKLDRAPVGKLLRVTVVGSGSQPVLGANLIPAGALRPDGDGQNISTSIIKG